MSKRQNENLPSDVSQLTASSADTKVESPDCKALKLDNQLCFPIYKISKTVINIYNSILAPLSLTYTQYLVMLVLWEHEHLEVREISRLLSLESNTLTPVINRLVASGYVEKVKKEDKRRVWVSLTDEGLALKSKALAVPYQLKNIVNLSDDEERLLCSLMGKVIGNLENYKK